MTGWDCAYALIVGGTIFGTVAFVIYEIKDLLTDKVFLERVRDILKGKEK